MAIIVGISSTGYGKSGSAPVDFLQFIKPVDASANLLVVLVSLHDDAAAVLGCTSITWNGVQLTRLSSKVNAAREMRAEIWYLKNPVAGGMAQNDVVINLPKAQYIVAGAMDISGVDGTNPFGTPVSAISDGATSASVNVVAAAGDMVLDLIAKKASTEAITPGANQAQLHNRASTSATANSNVIGGSSYKDGSAGGSFQMAWSWPTTVRQFVLIGVALKAPYNPFLRTLLPVADTYLSNGATGTNYGTNATLAIGKNTNTLRTLLKFDFSSVAGKGNGIVSATLRLCVNAVYGTSTNTALVFRCLRDWVEEQATWNVWKTGSSWQLAGGAGANDIATPDIGRGEIGTSSGNWYEIPLTASVVQQMADGVLPNYGFYLKSETEGSNQRNMRSSNYTPAGSEPQLILELRKPPPMRVQWWS